MTPFGKPSTLLLLWLLSALACSAWAESGIGKTILVKNTVTVQSVNAAPQKMKRGHVLHLGDTLRTGPDSRGIFRFNDGTLLTLGSNSEVKVETFVANDQRKQALFEFTKGALRVVTGVITQTTTPNFTVTTPMGSIGIRGTDFWAGNLSDDGSVDVLLLNSEHVLDVSNEFGQVVLTQAGEGTTLKPNIPPLSPRIWPQKKRDRALNLTQSEQP